MDVFSLDGDQATVVIHLGLGGAVVARAHREAVRDEVGEAEHQHDRARQIGTYNPGDDREGGDCSVNPTVNPVPDIVAACVLRETRLNIFPCVTVFERFARRRVIVVHGLLTGNDHSHGRRGHFRGRDPAENDDRPNGEYPQWVESRCRSMAAFRLTDARWAAGQPSTPPRTVPNSTSDPTGPLTNPRRY